MWLSSEWFSPDGIPGIAIPFYLAHPRLRKLEHRQILEVEGGTEGECMRILRHEAGHAIDTAYRLHRRKRWREIFGSFSQPYPDSYRPNERKSSGDASDDYSRTITYDGLGRVQQERMAIRYASSWVKDFYTDGQQYKFHFEEKGDTSREIPCRHDLEDIVHDYMGAAGIGMADPEAPLFRTSRGRSKKLTSNPMTANDLYRMVKRRFRDAGLPAPTFSCHSFRAGAATDLIGQGVPRKDVQRLLGHADPRTTDLYDHTEDVVTRNIVERISV